MSKITDSLGSTIEVDHYLSPMLCPVLCEAKPVLMVAVKFAEGGDEMSVHLTIEEAEQHIANMRRHIDAAKDQHFVAAGSGMHMETVEDGTC